MRNNKSLFSNIVKYVLLLVIVVGGGFGIYSYMNKNSTEQQIKVEKKVDSNQESKKKDEYVVDQAEKDYLSNKFKELKAINNEVIGYMYVPGDGKDSLKEPILQTTNNSKYLEYDINNRPAHLLGAVFMDFENKPGLDQGDVVMETPERKYYYEVTGVKVVHEDTNLYQIPIAADKKEIFINMFKDGARNWLENTKISGDDNMTVFATCRLDDVSLRTLVLARQVPDNELKEFLEKNIELLKS